MVQMNRLPGRVERMEAGMKGLPGWLRQSGRRFEYMPELSWGSGDFITWHYGRHRHRDADVFQE